MGPCCPLIEENSYSNYVTLIIEKNVGTTILHLSISLVLFYTYLHKVIISADISLGG